MRSQLSLICSLIFCFCSPVLAQSDDVTPEIRAVTTEEMYQPHIGIGAAVSSPEGSFNPGGLYSIEFGLQPVIPFSYAVKIGYGYYTDDDANFSRTSLVLEGKYNFGGNIPVIKYTYVGLGLGPAWEDSTVDEGMAVAFYPQVGFDIPLKSILNDTWSIGVNYNYLISSRSTPDTSNLSGVVKYWY